MPLAPVPAAARPREARVVLVLRAAVDEDTDPPRGVEDLVRQSAVVNSNRCPKRRVEGAKRRLELPDLRVL